MWITVESGMQRAATFAIPAAMPAHDPGDAASRGAGIPEMHIRGVS